MKNHEDEDVHYLFIFTNMFYEESTLEVRFNSEQISENLTPLDEAFALLRIKIYLTIILIWSCKVMIH